jgi:hypothetical protein
MSISPKDIIEDLEKYVDLFNLKLSKEAKKTLEDIEEFGYKCNYPCNYILFFSKTIRNLKELQRLFYNKGINPNLSALILEIKFYDLIETATNFQKGSKLYSYIHDRSVHDKTFILDKAMQYCVKDGREEIENKDILFSAMDYFERSVLKSSNKEEQCRGYDDKLTLNNIYGQYDENLAISFDEIRAGLKKSHLVLYNS